MPAGLPRKIISLGRGPETNYIFKDGPINK